LLARRSHAHAALRYAVVHRRSAPQGIDDLRASICLGLQYDEKVGAGAGNCEEIVSCHHPKGEIADYRDFDEDRHNRSQGQYDGQHHPHPPGKAVNSGPKKVGTDQYPKSPIAKYPNISKDTHDRSVRHHERGNASEEHLGPKGFAIDVDSAGGLIRFAIHAGNAYFEAVLRKPIELPPAGARNFVRDMCLRPPFHGGESGSIPLGSATARLFAAPHTPRDGTRFLRPSASGAITQTYDTRNSSVAMASGVSPLTKLSQPARPIMMA